MERQVFETLKLHFLPKRDENIIIIQGMNTVTYFFFQIYFNQTIRPVNLCP